MASVCVDLGASLWLAITFVVSNVLESLSCGDPWNLTRGPHHCEWVQVNPTEPVGVVCKLNGRVSVVEYSELPPALAAEKNESTGRLKYAAIAPMQRGGGTRAC